MLTVPASNVSVPLTVVMRTRSRVPPSANVPLPICPLPPSIELTTAEAIQVVPVIFSIVTVPVCNEAAAAMLAVPKNPATDVAVAELDAEL